MLDILQKNFAQWLWLYLRQIIRKFCVLFVAKKSLIIGQEDETYSWCPKQHVKISESQYRKLLVIKRVENLQHLVGGNYSSYCRKVFCVSGNEVWVVFWHGHFVEDNIFRVNDFVRACDSSGFYTCFHDCVNYFDSRASLISSLISSRDISWMPASAAACLIS